MTNCGFRTGIGLRYGYLRPVVLEILCRLMASPLRIRCGNIASLQLLSALPLQSIRSRRKQRSLLDRSSVAPQPLNQP